MKPTFPPRAREFLRSPDGRAAAVIAHSFHRWLVRRDVNLELADVMPDSVWWFVSVLGRSPREHYASAAEASQRWFQLFPYIEWLARNRWIRFDPEVLRSAPPPPSPDADPYAGSLSAPHFLWCHQDERPLRRRGHRPRALLPKPAQRFLAMLAVTRKPSTVTGYAYTLGRLYDFLETRQLSLADVSRRHLEDWYQALHACGLHPATRLDLLLQTRCYLRWAHDEGLVPADPDQLVRRSDFPKLPQYLPRPLPPDVDRELQARLAAGGPQKLALLLMRRTGLRIGELIGLEHQCLRADAKGRLYLKVPLGKLDTERLVPLDEHTVALLRRLQGHGPARALLLGDEASRDTRYQALRQALADASRGLLVNEPITSHRLRHTYATSLLTAGMSLPALMRILGHRDHRMTLRYAAITDDLVVKEYHEALTKLGERYGAGHRSTASAPPAAPGPLTLLSDVARWVKSRTTNPKNRNALVTRIRRLIADLRHLDSPTKR
jgi:site-specific recombinase XerD